MKLNELKTILRRLYRQYIKTYIHRIFLCLILSILVAGTSSAIAWLLDPAVKKIFIDKDKTLAWLIPLAIVFKSSENNFCERTMAMPSILYHLC